MCIARETAALQFHRNDIQSLRAFAIALVVAAHAEIRGLQGGFVGVDVFFVLSGYLISGLILSELETTKNFNVWRFYANRFKRLLPGLLLMLLATSAAAYWLANPWQQIRDATTAQAATLWLSNFYFASRTIEYFSSGLDAYLYLHTWSLAIEEQFYLFWPWSIMFLLAVWRYQGTLFSRKRLVIGLVLVFGSSLTLNVYLSQFSPEAGFYLMPGRVWEFTLGAFAFLVRQACNAGTVAWLDALRGRSLLNSMGIALILIAALWYSDSLSYPGLWALLPCVGTVLILLDAPERRDSSRMSTLLLRQRGILFLGDISYSLYLWHWPLLKLGNEIIGTTPEIRAGLICLSLITATLAYKWIENPLHRLSVHPPVKIWLSATVCVAGSFFCLAAWENAARDLTQTPAQKRIQFAKLDVPDIYLDDCDTWFHSSELSVCSYGKQTASHTLVLFGDSVAAQWFDAIKKEYVEARGWKLIVLTKSSCPVENVSFYYERIKSMYAVCDEWRKKAVAYINEVHPELVIMGSSNYGFTSKQLANGIDTTLKMISKSSDAIAVIVPTPRLGFDGPACLSKKVNWPSWLIQKDSCVTALDRNAQGQLKKSLKIGVSQFSNVEVIDLDELVCPDGICRAMINNTVVFRDSLHLTSRYVKSISPMFVQIIKAPGVLSY